MTKSIKIDSGFGFGVVLFRITCCDQWRQIAITVLFKLQHRPGPRELSLKQTHLIFPSHRHEVHVLLIPGVILFTDTGRARL